MTGWLLVVVALIVMLVGATAVAWVVRGRPRLGNIGRRRQLPDAALGDQGGAAAARRADGVVGVARGEAPAPPRQGRCPRHHRRRGHSGLGRNVGRLARTVARTGSGTLSDGSVAVIGPDRLRRFPQFRGAVVAPLTRDEVVVRAIVAYSVEPTSPAAVRATEELAVFASGQLDLAELDRARAERAEAEVRACGRRSAALRVQLPDSHRVLRAHRPGPGTRVAPGFRRLHLLLVPCPRHVHLAGRRVAGDRAVPAAGASAVRRAAAGPARVDSEVLGCASPSCACSRWSRTPCSTG